MFLLRLCHPKGAAISEDAGSPAWASREGAGKGTRRNRTSLRRQENGPWWTGGGAQHPDIVKMLQIASSEKRTFICTDSLDECRLGYRVKLLDSLNRILQKSQSARISVTRRPHIRPEIKSRLSRSAATVSITPRRDDVVGYLRTGLKEDTHLDANDSGLEAGIRRKILEQISEID